MVVFHMARDLEFFGQLPPGTTLSGGWGLLARAVAGSFLFLTGVSLVLAQGAGIHWPAFLRRLFMIGLAALAVTVSTWLAVPDRFIYFGILHAIFVCSIVGLFFVHLPAVWSFVGALSVWGIWSGAERSLDLSVWMGWTGLGQTVRPSLDFIPLVPWLAPCLLGIALTKLTALHSAERISNGPKLPLLTWPGRHSLAIYLLHQPVILSVLWVATKAAGAR